ncbi:hypothetical protein RclHR1_04930005 [Rhizophagus clarus]|uniref:Uncharacterized protein n=1 Tax=Rhizophagus clarus TaxID=94130 RepID=A0A2Z6RJI2_9GLOM|nr:hypothetical protein RclHR1_04930005 [Rhizophagus clarus]
MATPSHSPSVNENNEPTKGSALVRLYKPANIFPISFSLLHPCSHKVFSCLRVLLKEKLCSIRTRMDSDSSNNRSTKTYIRFANRDHVIYLEFYLPCKLECNLPAASVMSNKRWRCGEHYNEINACHKSGRHVPRDAKYYADELKRRAKKKKGSSREVKHIHSNRLGISYEVIIKMYKDISWPGNVLNCLTRRSGNILKNINVCNSIS